MYKLYFCAFIYFFINFFISKRMYKLYLVAILATIVYFSFHLQITPNMDLYRRLSEMELYREMGFQWVLENRMEDNPLGTLLFYGFSLLNDYRWVPAITAFICYGIAFYLLIKCADRYNLSKKSMNCLLLFFCLCFYYDHAVTNIRIYVCYALISLFLYKEVIENKCKIISWIVYVMCCYLHYAALPFVVIRLCLVIYRKKKNSLGALILITVCLSMFVSLLSSLFSGAGGVIGTAISKINGYEDYTTFGLFQFVSSILRIIPLTMLCLYVVRYGSKNVEKEMEICVYIVLLCILLLCMSNQYQLIYRTPNFLHYLGMVPISVILKNDELTKNIGKSYLFPAMQILLILSVLFTIGYQVLLIYPYVGFDI